MSSFVDSFIDDRRRTASHGLLRAHALAARLPFSLSWSLFLGLLKNDPHPPAPALILLPTLQHSTIPPSPSLLYTVSRFPLLLQRLQHDSTTPTKPCFRNTRSALLLSACLQIARLGSRCRTSTQARLPTLCSITIRPPCPSRNTKHQLVLRWRKKRK